MVNIPKTELRLGDVDDRSRVKSQFDEIANHRDRSLSDRWSTCLETIEENLEQNRPGNPLFVLASVETL